jgi:hypothetical protein
VGNELDFDEDFNPEARQLCPDGNCTGLIGDNGECKVCGGAIRSPDLNLVEEEPGNFAVDGDFDSRRLCDDGNCTGLLDECGVCKVCGKSS